MYIITETKDLPAILPAVLIKSDSYLDFTTLKSSNKGFSFLTLDCHFSIINKINITFLKLL
jgi:hypothetical protein